MRQREKRQVDRRDRGRLFGRARNGPRRHSTLCCSQDNIHFRPGKLPDNGGGLHTGYSAKSCRLLSVVYELAPVSPGQGGFGCLPGSHRDDAPPLPTHDGWRKPGHWATPEQRGPLWPQDVPVHRIEAELGDAIVFTEKLVHGTLPWAGGGERRTIFCAHAFSCPPIGPAAAAQPHWCH